MTKTGRARKCPVDAIDGFASWDLGFRAAWLDEYRERVYDQVEDLPQAALDYEGPGTRLTIGALVLHMAWAEVLWMSRITGSEPPEDLRTAMAPGTLEAFAAPPTASPEAAVIVNICRRVRDEITLPVLRPETDPDRVCWKGATTLRGILEQLEWHWIYHSGQVGLLRFEWGSDYTWTSDPQLAPPA